MYVDLENVCVESAQLHHELAVTYVHAVVLTYIC